MMEVHEAHPNSWAKGRLVCGPNKRTSVEAEEEWTTQEWSTFDTTSSDVREDIKSLTDTVRLLTIKLARAEREIAGLQQPTERDQVAVAELALIDHFSKNESLDALDFASTHNMSFNVVEKALANLAERGWVSRA